MLIRVRFLNTGAKRTDSPDAEPLEFSMLFRMNTLQRDQVPVDILRRRSVGQSARRFAALFEKA